MALVHSQNRILKTNFGFALKQQNLIQACQLKHFDWSIFIVLCLKRCPIRTCRKIFFLVNHQTLTINVCIGRNQLLTVILLLKSGQSKESDSRISSFYKLRSQKTRFKISHLLNFNSKRSDANSSQACKHKLSLVLKYRFRNQDKLKPSCLSTLLYS